MLEITVKTLDAQNHTFLSDADITVRRFKEQIAETVAIPADSQRLIYCGRVLQDEKKLTDYGELDGKVVHLVERAPPQLESRSSSNDRQRQNSNQGWQSGSHVHLRGHFPRNAMYLSAVSLPTEVVEDHGSQTPRLSNTLSNSRLISARRMLIKASDLMNRLDDPSEPLHPNPTENNSSESSSQAPTTGGETEQENSNTNENNTSEVNRIAQAASEMAAAFSAAALINIRLSPSSDGGNSINVMDLTEPDQNDQAPTQTQESELESHTSQAQSSETPDDSEPQRADTDRPEASTADTDNQNTSRRATHHSPRPPVMADLLERLVTAQDRLRPYIDRYRHLMSTDPVLTPGASGPEGVAENQRVVDGVSECLHYLAHASHALSDIIVDMGQMPPRNLRCRPIVIQSSAILQAGIPIQVESHFNLTGRHASANNTTDEGNEATRPSSPSSGTSAQNNRSNSTNNQTTSQSTSGQQNSGQPSLLGLLDLSNIVQMSTEQSPQNTVDLSSTNSVDASENDQNQTNNNNSTSNNVGGPGNVYMSQPFALIRDALQSVLGDRHAFQVETSGGAGAGNATSNVPFVTIVGQQMDINAQNSGQSTQARSNIGTHPTTSTQTRSTSRPHVLHPHTPLNVGMGMPQSLDFDPYLPCNSHHIRRNPPSTANSTTISQSNQPNPLSTAENNGRSQSASRSSASTSTSTSTSTRQGPGGASVTFTLVDHSNVARDILENQAQGLGAMALPLNLGDLLQSSVRDNVHISLVGAGPNASEVHMTPNSDLPLTDLLRSMNIRLDEVTDRNFLIELWIFLLRNVTFGNLLQLSHGQTTPLVNLRRPLREFLEHSFSDTPQETLQERVVDQIISLQRPYVQNLVIPEEEAAGRPVDVPATLEALLRRFCFDFLRLLFNNDLDNATFAQEALALGRKLEDQSSAVLQSILQGGQTALEAITSRFVNRLTEGVPAFFQQTLLGLLNARIRAYATRTTQMSQDEINSLLVFKDERASAPPAEDPPAPAPIPTTERTRARASAIRKLDADPEPEAQAQAQSLTTQQQQPSSKSELKNTEEIKKVESEPMETDESENKIAGFVDLAAGQDIPETFPGAENLPAEWVPIIARDSVRQRRQVQIDALNGGPIPFSDAYLSSMPSKRRKLIEQQKPQLLMNPTPTNTAIAASVERLVREGISHSRVDEVEGSATAVASAPAVRSAFGHAIRDCLHPSRLRTPDFPNARRFPNATKVFTNGEQDNDTPGAASSSSK